MTQTDIFALEKKRDRAIKQAEIGADCDWFDEATAAVELLILRKSPFTTDDVWRLIHHTGKKTSEPRAMGAVIKQFSKEKRLEQIGYRPSMRPECHMRPIAVWIAA